MENQAPPGEGGEWGWGWGGIYLRVACQVEEEHKCRQGNKKGQKKTDAIHANSPWCTGPKIGLIEVHSA